MFIASIYFFKRLNASEDEIKRRLAVKEQRNKIERSKDEARNNEDKLLIVETRTSKLLTHLKYEKEGILHDIMGSRLKLKILRVSSTQTNRINNLILSFNLCLYENPL